MRNFPFFFLLSVFFLPSCAHIDRLSSISRSGGDTQIARESSSGSPETSVADLSETGDSALSDDSESVARVSFEDSAASDQTETERLAFVSLNDTFRTTHVQNPETLSLSELEQIALENNPTLVQAQAAINAAFGNWKQVGLYPNPVIGYQGGEIGNDGKAGQQGAFLSQEVVTAGKLRLNRRTASHEVNRMERELEAQQYRVLTSVRTGYYEVLIAQRAVDLADQLLDISRKGVDAADALVKAKQSSRVDLLQARVEANNARVLLRNARNQHLAAWRRLSTVLGKSGKQPVRLIGNYNPELSDLKWEEALERILAGSPELQAAYARVRRSQAALRRARVEPIPNVFVQGGAQYDYSSEDTIAGIQLGVPIPIFNANQGNIRVAEAELLAAKKEVDRIRLAIENQLAAVMQDYASANFEVERYSKDILPDAKSSLDLVTIGYRQGEFDYLRFLTTQRTYFQTNIAYLEALQEWWTSKLQIDGLLLTDGLSTPKQ